METISKELLVEVLDVEALGVFVDSNSISYYNNDEQLEINIYELAHKCKEWAMKQEYHIFSKLKEDGAMASLFWNKDVCDLTTEYFYSDTEPEATFKACQWILENKG